MNYKEAVALVRERAVVRYGVKPGSLLRYLVEQLYPGKNKNKDIGFIEKTAKVSTLQAKIGFVSERHLRRILQELSDVVTLEWQNKRITYKVNLTPLTLFDYEGALNQMAQQRETKEEERLRKQAERMRERRAAERNREKTEELLQLLEQHKHKTVRELIDSIKAAQNVAVRSSENLVKGANVAR